MVAGGRIGHVPKAAALGISSSPPSAAALGSATAWEIFEMPVITELVIRSLCVLANPRAPC